MKKKQIELFLSEMSIPDFPDGSKNILIYEQYKTPSDIVADMLYYLQQNESLEDAKVLDLGCGTGILTTGMLYLGAHVTGVEIDKQIADETLIMLEDLKNEEIIDKPFQIINQSVQDFSTQEKYDLVVMNPPYGTKEENIDQFFVRKASQLCEGNIYSLHKSSTREVNILQQFWVEFALKVLKRKLVVVNQYKFPIFNKNIKIKKQIGKKQITQKYHKEDVVYIDVDFLCFQK